MLVVGEVEPPVGPVESGGLGGLDLDVGGVLEVGSELDGQVVVVVVVVIVVVELSGGLDELDLDSSVDLVDSVFLVVELEVGEEQPVAGTTV